jgi:hypothetical protein
LPASFTKFEASELAKDEEHGDMRLEVRGERQEEEHIAAKERKDHKAKGRYFCVFCDLLWPIKGFNIHQCITSFLALCEFLFDQSEDLLLFFLKVFKIPDQ